MSLARLFRAVGLLAFGLASAQSQVPNFQGHVYDSRRHAIEGATVSIGPNGRSTKPTDSDGFFSIEPAPSVKPASPITVQIFKDGFKPYSKQMEYTGVSQVFTLTDAPGHRPPPVRPAAQPTVQTQPPVPGPTVPPPPTTSLWSPTGDIIIDSVQEKLNGLSANPTDAQTTSALRGLFDASIFGSVGEELPEDALYSFCRTEQILMHYQLRFSAPELRTAASTASQNLIYLQNIFAELYGPAFSAQEQCNRFGSRPRSEYQANLANRLKPRDELDSARATKVLNQMLTTLYAVGLSSHAPPPPPPPAEGGGTGSNPTAKTFKVQIDSARLNKWLDQGNESNRQYWLKSVSIRIDNDEWQIAKDLAFTAEVPQVNRSFTLTKGRHTVLFQLVFDVERFRIHKQYPKERLVDIEVDQDLMLTPFLTVTAGEITQCLLLNKTDPIPGRTP